MRTPIKKKLAAWREHTTGGFEQKMFTWRPFLFAE